MGKKAVKKIGKPRESAGKAEGLIHTPDSPQKPESQPVVAPPETPPQPKTSAVEEAIKNNPQIELVTPEVVPVFEKKEHELLAFVVSGEEYGVDIMAIKEIIRPVDITYVPRVPDYVKGIISLRGTVVPIFDMAKRLGLKGQQPGKRSRIVVITLGTSLVGFSVDSVTEVVRIKETNIEPPPPTLTDGMAECVRGVAHFKERLIIIMDVEKTLSAVDLSVEHPISHTSSKAGELSK